MYLTDCDHCGTAYDDKPGVVDRFCSEACESAYYEQAQHPKCTVCGGAVTGRHGVTYCSPACRQKAYRQRRKPIEPAPTTADESSLVEVYRILTKAAEPLTIPQIAKQMPRTGLLSWAMNRYREHKEQTDPAWLKGKGSRWGSKDQAEAMVWWVRQVVSAGLYEHFDYANRPHAEEATYEPGKRVPKVQRMVWVQQPVIEDWTLERAAELNDGHVAGMQFLTKLAEYRGRGKRIPAETQELLELAERAVKAH